MPSLHPDFEYDIFISYRQKDNKYDGWVTEFVGNLRKELEATFKDDVSIYFDENPHDGLLETHSVDRSLKGKLRSLILVPIISRTYCDPKSFAWQNEFVSFAESIKGDPIGSHVRLTNGNVASRILPVRIHELDAEDVSRFETVTGEAIRPVDFIYRLPGVNRELRARDDDQIKSPNQVLYRDQVNKVAQAIREIIQGIRMGDGQEPLLQVSPRASAPTQSNAKTSRAWVVGSLVIFMALVAMAAYKPFTDWRQRERVRRELIPAIQQIVSAYDFAVPSQAFELAVEASRYLPDDSVLLKNWGRFSRVVWLNTDPPGARVFWKDYERPGDPWKDLGTTPLDSVRIPLGIRVKLEKPGYETVLVTAGRIPRKGQFKLDSLSELPDGMVRIPARVSRLGIVGLEQHDSKWVSEFLVDRFEVTNEDYARFVEAGGYQRREYWKEPLYQDGHLVPWETAIKMFVDQTGRPGPATWEAGTFKDGEEKHPVAGVSYYEAAAYASFTGKQLPTVYHWALVTETNRANAIIPLSNFSGIATSPVGTREGISTFGIYDLAGNVREWCTNEVDGRQNLRYIMGGGWNDASYAFNDAYGASMLDRAGGNGFRCIKVFPGDTIIQALSQPLQLAYRDYRSDKPVDDKAFEIVARQFRYDKTPLRAQEENVTDSGNWKVQRVTMDAAYGSEKLTTYLYIPLDTKPPYQPILYFPGSQVIFLDDIDSYEVQPLDFVLKSGRVLVYPVYKGTYTRKDEGLKSDLPNETVAYRDHVIMWSKDLGRVIDYLETRSDFNTEKVGYFGVSWGASMGPILCAIESRIDAIVIRGGGLPMSKAHPEADMLNFLPRVHQPVLVLNGRHDNYHPVETSQKPMVTLFGTPEPDKRYVVYETGHTLPRLEHIKETLQWFDRYLGKTR